MLALLVLSAGRVVLLDDFVDELWPVDPPASAVPNVRGYVGQLRRSFASVEPGQHRLVRHGAGYLLHAEPDELDVAYFTAKVAAGREALRCDDPKGAAARFGEALSCWRGPMLAGLSRGPVLRARCAPTEDERLTLTEELAQLLLRQDELSEAVGLLRGQVREFPLRERGHLLLMRALYRLNDVTGALATYMDVRTALRERLGVNPGPELQDLHRAILNREPAEAPTRAEPAVTASPHRPANAVPAQLPLDVRGFTGRAAHLERLDSLLAAAAEQPTAVVVSAIAGTAGVGKTALAVHWAHRMSEEFPDGRLYINLRGFGPKRSIVGPAEAIRNFLDALGVPPDRIPIDLDAQVGLYRTILSTRRALVVLDNARDTDQVRPLLPGAPGCFVVVTSRNQLTGLIAAEGAHALHLDVLSAVEARTLLERRLGADRLAADPNAVDEIVGRCARLPLALAIVAARATARPHLSLATIAAELADTRRGLDVLNAGDLTTDVRAVFSWSYQTLSSAAAARLFRHLGLHPGPDISAAAAASLAGVPAGEARRLLAELTRAHLASESSTDRYSFHDLLRAYAAERARKHDSTEDRHAALHRVLDHYLHTANAAADLIYPQRTVVPPASPQPGVSPERPADQGESMAWFAAEHDALKAAVRVAADAGFGTHACQLAVTFTEFLDRTGHWRDIVETQDAALDAARRLGDRSAQARAYRGLGLAYARLGDHDRAYASFLRAEEIYRELGQRIGQLQACRALAWVCGLRERYADAVCHAQRALSLVQDAGNDNDHADALNALGYSCALAGNHKRAIRLCTEALELYRRVGNRSGEADAWHSLGCAHHGLGSHNEATACHRRAISLYRDIGHRHYEAFTLNHLGDALDAAGDPNSARTAWQEALDVLDQLGHADAAEVRNKLTGS